MDREKVIKGLEQFRTDLKPFCGNHADWERFDDALALLKEQEKALYELWQLLKEAAEKIERLKTPTAGDNHIP